MHDPYRSWRCFFPFSYYGQDAGRESNAVRPSITACDKSFFRLHTQDDRNRGAEKPGPCPSDAEPGVGELSDFLQKSHTVMGTENAYCLMKNDQSLES